MSQLEQVQCSQVTTLQLHKEEREDRSRRNNLRLHGIPEATGQKSQQPTALEIFWRLATSLTPQDIEFDRMHRALSPRSMDPNRPRDFICCLHRYSHKDLILRRAWEVGDFDFEGATVKILPDLFRATLQQRALLHTILDTFWLMGFTYQWGFPMSLTGKVQLPLLCSTLLICRACSHFSRQRLSRS